MTWDDITPNLTDYGSQSLFLKDYHDAFNEVRAYRQMSTADAVTDIFLAEAKAEVLRDLQLELQLNPDDADHMVILDDLVDAQQSRVRFAIALQQLIQSFAATSQGEQSENHRLWKLYTARYEKERSGFKGLRTTQGNSTTTSTRIYG